MMTSRLPLALQQARWPALLLAAGLSGAGFYLSSAGADIPAAAWIAPVPVLAFAFAPAEETGNRRRRIAVAAFIAGALGQLSWLVLYRGLLPAFLVAGFPIVVGAAFAFAAWLTAWVSARRSGPWGGVVLFPAFWVAFELGIARWSPHGSAGSLAYSQDGLLPLIQLAAWTGLAGITFVLQFVAAGIAAAAGTLGDRIRWPLLVVPAATLAAAFAVGQARVETMTHEATVTVGLASVDDGMRRFDATAREQALPVVNAYLEAAHTLAVRRVEAIVLPEKMVGVAPDYEDEVVSLLSSLAERDEVLLVAGLNLTGRPQPRNIAAIFSRGRRALQYDKRRLVPGLEAEYAAGEGPGTYRAPGGMTGVAICKDMDFAEVGREYGRAGVGLLFVPAWDFRRDARLHSRMAVLRGVEGGYSVARAAANGLLTGSDDLGQVLAERASDAAPRSMMLVALPLGRGQTFYSEHGDWFAWLCVMGAAGLVAVSLWPKS